MRFSNALENRVLQSLAEEPNTCIVFPEKEYRNGTILVYRDNLVWRLHRYLYEERYGELEEGWFMVRSCKNPLCENPNHFTLSRKPYLERIACPKGHRYTKKNTLPADSRDRCRTCYEAKLARRRKGVYGRGYCRKGHELTPENRYKDGRCRQCHIARMRNARMEKRNAG